MLRKALFYLSITLTTVLFVACNPIEVTVQNSGSTPLGNVVVRTEQRSYTFGDISPGESVAKGIDALGDSDLSIYHSGLQEWQRTDTYITRGYVGKVTLELENGEVVNVVSDLRVGP